MKVILLENIAKVGHQFEVVDVASGHALNFLIPQKKALAATPSALKELETERTHAEEKRAVATQSLAEAITKVDGKKVTLEGVANEEGHLFAGIHKNAIAEAINAELGVALTASQLDCTDPIKEVGEYTVTILGPEGQNGNVTLIVEAEK